ncbi:MAG: hypothetical protein Unbinned96contig1001_56 [Prokaryotic dsDNA virus sp.]|nr:MAG: hypothetical protein Unbinned96contig1001_56 [Prokaryotic dsDNA virus sp.]|tara:strand:- start:146 stop:727 length:582 start_codon:yes stop_codon:yes gene_type:complete
MKKLTIRQQVNSVNKWLDMATKHDIKAGMEWYSEAQQLCATLAKQYDVSLFQVAQVVSVLSPQKKWETNKLETIALFNEVFNGVKPSFKYFASKKMLKECKAIINGTFTIPYNRTKTYSFADNISNKESEEVTVDRHALRVAYDDKTASIDKVSVVQYREVREVYKIVANQHGLKPYQVQAITWVVYKRVVNR